MKGLVGSLRQIEVVFLLLSLLTLISTSVLQSMTESRLSRFRHALSQSERNAVLNLQVGSTGLPSGDDDLFDSMVPYDGTMAALLHRLSAHASAPPSTEETLGLFQDIQERLHAQEQNIRRGYQSLYLLGFLFLSVSILVILAQSNRKRLQRERLEHEKELSDRQLAIQQMEQNRIARELHDGVAQELARAKLLARASDGSGVRDAIDSALKEIRWLCGALRDASQDRKLLEDILMDTMDSFAVDGSFRLERTVVTSRRSPWDAAQRFELNRILQEALTNVARHAGADLVRVAVVEVGDFLRINIEDNGIGLRHGPGLGMRGLAERCALLGGTSEWQPVGTGGTRLLVAVPLPKAREEAPE